MKRQPRMAYVVTVALPSAALALGCCPSKIDEGDPCYFFQTACSERNDDCGSNGFSCVKGKWHEDFTYCNPPGLSPTPTTAPSSVPVPSSSAPAPASSASAPASSASAHSSTAPPARGPER